MILNPWREINRLKKKIEEDEELAIKALDRVIDLEDALWEIAGLETPRASNVVKKAARIARKAIGWEE